MTDTANKKFELASPEFVTAFGDFMRKGLAKENLTDVKFNYSWVATNAPAHLLKSAPANTYGRDAVGWSWSVRDGKVQVGNYPLPPEQNDFYLKTNYARLREWIKLTDAQDAVFMGLKPGADGKTVNTMQAFIEAGELELHYTDPAVIQTIGKLIVASDWRDSFFSKYVV